MSQSWARHEPGILGDRRWWAILPYISHSSAMYQPFITHASTIHQPFCLPSAMNQPFISPSAMYQPCISHASAMHQPFISHTSAILPSISHESAILSVISHSQSIHFPIKARFNPVIQQSLTTKWPIGIQRINDSLNNKHVTREENALND